MEANTPKLTGHEAIAYAEANSLTLNKYADPIEDAREGLTPAEARKVAAEDPSLIWIAATTYEIRLTDLPPGTYVQMFLCGPSNGNGNPDKAYCRFDDRADAEQVVTEFYEAKSKWPGNFPSNMEAEIVEMAR